MKTYHTVNRFLFILATLLLLLILVPATASSQSSHSLAIVSAASFEPAVAPASLATIFGRDLARAVVVGQLNADGSLPEEIDGVSVEWEGRAAQLVYVSPTQVNFLVPAQARVGEAIVTVKRKDSQSVQTGIARIKLAAPGLFTLECLRSDRAAAQNGVTYELEPFRATTSKNPGDDKRTRLSIYGTGFRFASNPSQDPAKSNVAPAVNVEVTDPAGNISSLLTEYAGPSPVFAGLDQINVILPYSLDDAGLLKICLSVGTERSNCVTVLSASKLPSSGATGRYMITRVAGDGSAGYRGDSQDALAAKLTSPAAVAIDRQLNLYVADSGNRVIRRIGVNGKISTYAGTGQAGSEGDGGPARDARFRSIAGLATDELDNLYVVDSEDHRVRRIDPNGLIHAFAGTGVAGFSGDRGTARQALLSSPSALAIDKFGGVLIADSANHRIRKVTRDGLIQTFAGTGEAGFSGDGYPAFQAKLNYPDSVAVSAEGVVFVADGKNYRIRRIARDGTIRTLAGNGEPGSGGEACDASVAQLKFPVRLALDKSGRLFIADSSNERLRAIDSNCTINPIAGVGRPGYGGDGGAALEAILDTPLGLSVSPLGEVFFADSDNHRVRKLMYVNGACGDLAEVSILPRYISAGQSATGYVRLHCPVDHDVQITLSATDSCVSVPAAVVLQPGTSSASFPVSLVSACSGSDVKVEARDGRNTVETVIGISDDGDRTGGGGDTGGNVNTPLITVTVGAVTGGQTITGRIEVNEPAPPTGLSISLTSNNAAAQVAGGVTIPEGQSGAEFLVNTSPVSSPTNALVTATGGGASGQGNVLIQPAGTGTVGPTLDTLRSFTVAPASVPGGQGAMGTVALNIAAPPGGVLVYVSSNNPAVSVPPTLVIAGGLTTSTFAIGTSSVPVSTPVTITAASKNSLNAPLTVTPLNAPSSLGSVTVAPGSITGGQGATGTVTLTSPAPAGGVTVQLTSNNPAVSVPGAVFIPAGATSATFPVTTSSVPSATSVTVTATAPGSSPVNTQVQLNPAGVGTGTISSLTLSPATVTGGSPSTGTVQLASPAGVGGVLVNLGSNSASATVPGSITIAQGASSGTFTVTTTSVGSQVTASISATSANSTSANLTIAPSGPGTGTISSLTLSPTSVTGGSPSTGTVQLSAPAGVGGVLVNLSSNSASATVPVSITIPQGASSGTFAVATTAVGSSTTATITATSANGTTASLTLTASGAGQGTIASMSLSPSSVVSGSPSTGTVNLSSPAPAGGILVNLSSDNTAATVPASIVIPAGASSGTFSVTTTPVGSPATATITGTSANTTTATLSLTPPGPGTGTISSLTLSPTSVTGGSPSTGTVQLSAPAGVGGVLVNLGSNSASATVPASITITQGASSGTFTVTTAAVGSQTTASISATSANSTSANLTIDPSGPGTGTISSLTLSPSSVTGGSPSTGTVQLSAPAGVGGVLVNLGSNSASATVPASITIAHGASSGTFTVTTTAVGSQVTASISATSANSTSANLTINPSIVCANSLVLNVLITDLLSGSGTLTATTTLSGPSPNGGTQVQLVRNAVTLGTINIPQGQTSGSVSLQIANLLTMVGSTVQAVINGCPAVHATISLGAPITGTIANLTLNPSTVTAGANVTGTVTLGSPAGANGVLVNLSSGNPAAAMVSTSVVVPAGSLSATFPVNTVNTSPAVVNVSISASSGASNQAATLTINSSNPCVDSLSLSANITNLATGAGVLNALVTLTGPAPQGGTTVPLLVGATQIGQIAIPANQSSGSGSVLVANLPTLLGSVLRAVTGPCPGATATISASVPGIASVNLPAGLTFGQNGNATVTLSAAAPAGGALVELSKTTSVSGLTASLLNTLLGSVVLPASVTVPAGQLSVTFPVQTSALGGTLNTALALLGINNVGFTVQSTLQTAFTPSSWSGLLTVAR